MARVHPSGWNVISMADDADIVREVHVIPVDDLRPHEPSRDCWCGTFEDDEDPTVIGHNSMDRRELIETGSATRQ
jgi:hypothetical protein